MITGEDVHKIRTSYYLSQNDMDDALGQDHGTCKFWEATPNQGLYASGQKAVELFLDEKRKEAIRKQDKREIGGELQSKTEPTNRRIIVPVEEQGMENIENNINYLNDLLRAKSMTRSRFARAVGVTPATVQRWCKCSYHDLNTSAKEKIHEFEAGMDLDKPRKKKVSKKFLKEREVEPLDITEEEDTVQQLVDRELRKKYKNPDKLKTQLKEIKRTVMNLYQKVDMMYDELD